MSRRTAADGSTRVGLLARELWAEAFSVQRAGVDVRAGLAGAAACSVPLALGIALGEEAIGVTASFGGLNAALGVPRGALRERIGWGGGAALGCCLSVVAATAVQDSIAASAVAAFVLVGLAAFLRTFGANGGMTGFVIGAIFVIMNGIPSAPLDVGERTLWFALGSLAGVVLMVAGYGRDASPPRKAASAFTTLLVLGARQFRDALARDRLLRAHALRLASIVALTTLVYQLLGLQHGYWVPLTVLAVLQPEEHASSVRAIQRATGTLIGTAVIAVLTIATGEEWLMVGGQCIAAFGLFALHSRGYFWLVVLLTPTALLTLSAVDYQGDAVALERAAWSALGIVLGVGVAELAWRLPHHRPRAAGSSPAPAVRSSPPP